MKACIHISMIFLLFIHHVLMCTVVQFRSFHTLFSLSVQEVTPNPWNQAFAGYSDCYLCLSQEFLMLGDP